MSASSSGLQGGVAFAFALSYISVISAAMRLVPKHWVGKRRRAGRVVVASSRRAARPRRRTVRGTLVWYAILSLLLWIFYGAHAWTLASVGVTRPDSPVVDAIAGVMIYYALLTLYGVFLQLLKRREIEELAHLRLSFAYLPNEARARCIVIAATCLANPVVEELIFRGLLVHQHAELNGNLARALLIGAVVNATNHAYQGWRAAPFHLMFYAAAVGLMYSPYGLAASIGLHYVADAVPLLALQERLRKYRQARKTARRALLSCT